MPQDRLLWGLWLAIVVSNLATGYLGGAIFGLITFAQVMFQYILIRTAVRTLPQLRGAVILLTCFMLFHALSGIQQWNTGFGFGGVEPVTTDGQIRIRSVGIFNDPNDLALSILVVLPFLFVTVLNAAAGWGSRIIAIAVLVPMLLALYYTNSRGGVLGLAAALVIIAWHRFGRKWARSSSWPCSPPGSPSGRRGWRRWTPTRTRPRAASRPGRRDCRCSRAGRSPGSVTADSPTTTTWWRTTPSSRYSPSSGCWEAWPSSAWCSGISSRCGGSGASLETRNRRSGPRRTGFLAMGTAFFIGTCFLSRQYNPVLFTVIALGACFVTLAKEDGANTFAVSSKDRWRLVLLTFGTVVLIWITARLFGAWGG